MARPKKLPRGVFENPKGSGNYWIDYTANGRRRREPGGPTLEHAKALLAKRKAEVFERSRFPLKKRSGLVLGAFDASYLEPPGRGRPTEPRSCAELWFREKRAKKSIAGDVSRWTGIAAYFGERTTIDELDAEWVAAFRSWLQQPRPADELQAQGARREKLSAASANHHLRLLRSALNLASARGYGHPHPFDAVKLLAEDGHRRAWTKREYRLFLEHAEDERLRLLIVLAYSTGLRLGSLLALRWEWIDLEEGFIDAPPGIMKTGKALVVPLTDAAIQALRAWDHDHDGRLFDTTTSNMSPKFSALKRKLGFGPEVTFHSARHSAAEILRAGEVDLKTAQEVLGHSTTTMALRYQHRSRKELKQAVRKAFRDAY